MVEQDYCGVLLHGRTENVNFISVKFHRKVSPIGNPPALPVDSQSLTVPGISEYDTVNVKWLAMNSLSSERSRRRERNGWQRGKMGYIVQAREYNTSYFSLNRDSSLYVNGRHNVTIRGTTGSTNVVLAG